MSKRIKDRLVLAIVIVAAVVVCLLTEVTPDPVDPPSEKPCPYQTQTPSCSYQWGR